MPSERPVLGEMCDWAGMLPHNAVSGGDARRALLRRDANLMATVHVFYATRDGQAWRIASRIVARLAERAITVSARDLATTSLAPADLAAGRLVVVVAAVRYGRHLPEAERFLATYQSTPVPAPLVFISVNLTARKPGRDTIASNQYLRKSIARHRLNPVFATAVAGRLDYPHYGWVDRQIIRLIMWMTGGPADPRCRVEFTDWNAVDVIAARIADLHGVAANQGSSVHALAS